MLYDTRQLYEQLGKGEGCEDIIKGREFEEYIQYNDGEIFDRFKQLWEFENGDDGEQVK